MGVHKAILRRLSLEGGTFEDLFSVIRASSYDPTESQGFIVDEEGPGWLRGFFITKLIVFENKFVLEEMKVVRQQVQNDIAVPFLIDAYSGTLDVQSNMRMTSRLIDQLGALSRYTALVDDLEFDLLSVYRALSASGWRPRVNRIRARDFVVQDGVLGDVTLRVSEGANGEALLKTYSSSLVSVGFLLTVEGDNQVPIVLTRNGSITFPGELNEVSFLQRIKAALLRGG